MNATLDGLRASPIHAVRVEPTRSAVILGSRPLLLEMLERLLETIEIRTVCKTTASRDALGAVRTHRPDVFLIDVQASAADDLQTVREARSILPDLVAVALTDPSDGRHVAAAFEAGAAATVSRAARPEDVVLAVRLAVNPTMFFAHPGWNTLTQAQEDVRGTELTKREREILKLVAEGHSNSRVARTLWVTEQTVKFHLSNIYRKLNVSNRTEASRWAQVNGLLPASRQPIHEPAVA